MSNDAKDDLAGRKTTSARIPIWLKLCLWTALACIGQLFVFALIGVIRGYSIQSRTPMWVMLGGVFLLLFCFVSMIQISYHRKEKTPSIWISYLISFCLMFVSVVGISQGRYQGQGEEFYKQKNYPAAITLYQKEIDTWYLRLVYNYREDTSLFGIAQSYCQLGDFEQARVSYQRLIKMSRGYYQGRSRDELAELDREMKNIAAFKEQLDTMTDDSKKADLLFDLAIAYRRVECGQKARDQYALVQTLDVRESRKTQAKKFAASDRW